MKCCVIWAIIVVVTIPLVFSSETSCNTGDCCKQGKVLPNETLCRPARNDCDVAEHCTGTSGRCPLDISSKDGTHCGTKENPGKCLKGFCLTEAVKGSKLGLCIATCSKDRGHCSESGECVCQDGWISPPLCNKNKTVGTIHDAKMSNSIKTRHRRTTGKAHHHHHSNHHSARAHASHHHKHGHKPLAQKRDSPTEDTWTTYTKNPLFIPIVVTIVAVIILIISGMWAMVLYQSELKARKLRERIKVERSRRHIPKDVSKITDPSVNIDVNK